jgi:hypothetical protein
MSPVGAMVKGAFETPAMVTTAETTWRAVVVVRMTTRERKTRSWTVVAP